MYFNSVAGFLVVIFLGDPTGSYDADLDGDLHTKFAVRKLKLFFS